ncbi:MAG: hypothetical protein PHC43_01050 [Candidatus Marinimicrobia bacterium]|jgi:hypothetical protein|nr:hypothetical protein [Candidatus Neomarinimicrobiota bacterium]MDD5229896.1 hypothetical protein [Candidatus Neomarinimicrobiota bacterium]MDD5539873.1 hypothetical protein [Candidatus Neomarinimicrobiota bacterium]
MLINDIERRCDSEESKVLFRLWIARLRNEKFFLSRNPDEVISGGFLPMYAFRSGSLGGDSADRRLRFLRDNLLIPIEIHKHTWKTNPKKKTYLYRLNCNPYDLDWDEYFTKKGRFIYHPKSQIIEKSGQVKFA